MSGSADGIRPFLRFVGRYAIAAVMIPVGVALGIGGLIQYRIRRRGSRPTAG